MTLELLRKVAQAPDDVTAADIRPLREAGVSDEAIEDALHVLYLFSIYTRLADTLGWELPKDAEYYKGVGKRLMSRGYTR